MMKNKTVVVGMSGGVDSSVAAYLLKNQGFHVIGVTMQLWPGGTDTAGDAKQVADFLDMPFYVMDFREDFHEHVIRYFAAEYRRGRTPNPCIACNRYVKWEALLKKSLALGADYVATGHYAKVKCLPNGRYTVSRSGSGRKDQTYALYSLTQNQLAHTLFPVGGYEKEEIRDIAKKSGIPTAIKPDSQEICFVRMKKKDPGTLSAWMERYSAYIRVSATIRWDRGKALASPLESRFLLWKSGPKREKWCWGAETTCIPTGFWHRIYVIWRWIRCLRGSR